jgi:hypothetical protein
MFVIDGNGLGPLCGKFIWFSLVKTDLNCSLRILALLWMSLRKTNQKHRAHAKARKTKKKKDKDRYKRLQTEVQYEIRKAGKKYMTDLI